MKKVIFLACALCCCFLVVPSTRAESPPDADGGNDADEQCYQINSGGGCCLRNTEIVVSSCPDGYASYAECEQTRHFCPADYETSDHEPQDGGDPSTNGDEENPSPPEHGCSTILSTPRKVWFLWTTIIGFLFLRPRKRVTASTTRYAAWRLPPGPPPGPRLPRVPIHRSPPPHRNSPIA
jgi:hypothetical protein